MPRTIRLMCLLVAGAFFACSGGEGATVAGDRSEAAKDDRAVVIDGSDGAAFDAGGIENVTSPGPDGAPPPPIDAASGAEASSDAPSDSADADVDAAPPSNGVADPLNLHVASLTQIAAQIAWSEPPGGPYQAAFVYAEGNAPPTCEPSANAIGPFSAGPAGTTQIGLHGLTPNTTYGVRVCFANTTPTPAVPDYLSLGATVTFTTSGFTALPDPSALLASNVTKFTAHVSWAYAGSTNPGSPDAFQGFSVSYAAGAPPAQCDPLDLFGPSAFQGRFTIGLSNLTPGTTYGVRVCTRRGTSSGTLLSPGQTVSFTTQSATVDAGSDSGGGDAGGNDAGGDASDSGTTAPPKPTFVGCDTDNIEVRWSGTASFYRVIEKDTPLDGTCGGGTIVVDAAGVNKWLVASSDSVIVYVCGFDGATTESAPLKVDVKIPFVPGTGSVTCATVP